MHIIIGVSAYGLLPRVNGFIKSIMNNIEDVGQHTIRFVCYDDGTEDPVVVRERRTMCQRYGFQFVINMEQRGKPFVWNCIAGYEKADLAIIFNHDVRFLSPGWLTRLLFFFEKNNNIGFVGMQTFHEMGIDSNQLGWFSTPQRIISPIDRAFAICPDLLLNIQNENNSRGFPENDLITSLASLGSKLTENKFFSYLLPWPPIRYIEEQCDQVMVPWQSTWKEDRQVTWLDRDGNVQIYQDR